ncbi:MAG: hypothetical protein ACFFC7_30185, partial [Candidatus Hermodarchaeota archaeon]
PEDKDIHLDEIKDAYDKMNNLPSLEAQEKTVTSILDKLFQGKKIAQQDTENQRRKRELFDSWVKLTLLCQQKLKESVEEIEICEEHLNELEPHSQQLRSSLDNLNLQIPYLTQKSIQFQIQENKTKIRQLKRELKAWELDKNILEVLTDYREWKLKSKRLSLMKEQLLEEVQPILQDLILSRRVLKHLYDKEVQQLQKKEKENNEALESVRKTLDQAREENGRKKERERMLKELITEAQQEIDEITRLEQRIKTKSVWKDRESLNDTIQLLSEQFTSIISKKTESEKEKSLIEQNLKNLHSKIERTRAELQDTKAEKEKIEEKLKERKNKWKRLVQDPRFCAFFGAEWEEGDVNYAILSSENKKSLKKEEERIYEWLATKTHYLLTLKRNLETFETEEQFSYDSELVALRKTLQNKNINAWIGWEYLKKTVLDTQEKEKIVRSIAYLLDGLIVTDSNLDRTRKVIEKLIKNCELGGITKPVLISVHSILKNPPTLDRNVMLVNPVALNWRYDKTNAKKYFQKQMEQYEREEEKVASTKEDYNRLKQVIHRWEDFLESFPQDEFLKLEKKCTVLETTLQDNENMLSELINERERLEDQLKVTIELLKELEIEKDTVNSEKQQLEKFQLRYRRKSALQKRQTKYTEEYQSISTRLDELEEVVDKFAKQEKDLRDKLVTITDNLSESRNLLKKYSRPIKLKDDEKLSAEEIEQKAGSMSLQEWINVYEELDRQYNTQFSESELRLTINSLESDIKTLEDDLTKRYTLLKITEKTIVVYNQENPDLKDKQAIFNKKQQLEQTIRDSLMQINELERETSTYQKEAKKQQSTYLAIEKKLEKRFIDLYQDKEAIIKILTHLKQQKASVEDNLAYIEDEINETRTHHETASQQKKAIEAQLKVIDVNIQYFATELSEEDIDQLSMSDIDKLSINEIEKQVDKYNHETEQFRLQEMKNENDIKNYIQEFRALAKDIDPYLKEIRLIDFIKSFNKENVQEISSLINIFQSRLLNLQEQIKAPKERLENIVKFFTAIVHDILYKLKELPGIKLRIPDLLYLDNKPVIKILIRGEGGEEVINEKVKHYFTNLFASHQQFPEFLTIEKIILTILEDYLEGRLRPIKYLFPDNKQEASYKTIEEIKKASGGERVTVGILLYCLIAYFRLKYVFGEENFKNTHSFPLLMDNPFGKASRLDFIKLQVGLAKRLNIQLIPFTAIGEIEIFHYYDAMIPLKKYPTQNEFQVIEIDRQESEYLIKGSSVTVRPIINQNPPITL